MPVIKDSRVCTLDLSDRKNVIQCFRDFLNMYKFIDYNEEALKLRAILFDLGWSKDKITEMELAATKWLIIGNEIPYPIKEQGDRFVANDIGYRGR